MNMKNLLTLIYIAVFIILCSESKCDVEFKSKTNDQGVYFFISIKILIKKIVFWCF